ncbi:MAG: type III-B CRISPR module-associated protein Cmr5 [Gammaproteobacteria bacterium]|nr:type III-B CRISPR module-associated protein Cmr5 [Gammaproteobacteria bacterium]
MPQTIEQQRAAYALKRVNHHLADAAFTEDDRKEFNSYAQALPAMIHTNGLGQAMAFYRSKGGNHERIYQLLSGWLCRENQPYSGQTDLLTAITQTDMHHYRMAQVESQALLGWLKRFTKAFMAVEG